MQFIVAEKRRPRSWFYEDGKYYSLHNITKETMAVIKGEDIPDPNKLRSLKLQFALNAPAHIRKDMRYNVDPVVIDLFNHYQSIKGDGL